MRPPLATLALTCRLRSRPHYQKQTFTRTDTRPWRACNKLAPIMLGGTRLSVDRFVWQVVLMPYGVENAEHAGEADAENPGKVPHAASSIETGRIALDLARRHHAA